MLLGSRIPVRCGDRELLLGGIYAAAIAFSVCDRGQRRRLRRRGGGVRAGSLHATFGLLIAAIGRTPEATRGIAIVATLLLVMLGGAWVPTFVFPAWLQTATLVVPTAGDRRPRGDDLARPPVRRGTRAGRGAARLQRGVRVDRGAALRLGGVSRRRAR
ncbi:MAG: ABC transporter permease [Betaproteobacteria bacterium]|nr:ABC transporter permease [Betaproteobacteria bacterium]